MKIAIVRKFSRKIEHYKKDLAKLELKYSTRNPDFVVSIGGDGTLLEAERRYLGVPKIPVKESNVCVLCQDGDLASMLSKVKKRKYKIVTYAKVKATVKGKTFIATNDFIIRNKNIQEALRFTVKMNKKHTGDVIIGDGIVVATSFGSTGYYHSITYDSFSKGFGIAFNNPTRRMKSFVLGKNDVAEFTLLRGQGLLATDNDKKVLPLKLGDTIKFRLSNKKTKIVRFT